MEFSVPMALVDFIPVIFFGIAAILLMRGLYNKMSKGAYALFAAGEINVFMAGFLKALYKLLYAGFYLNFDRLNQMFLPVQAIGFLLSGCGLVAMMSHKQGKSTLYSFMPLPFLFLILDVLPIDPEGWEGIDIITREPILYSGTMIFIVLMVVGLGMRNAVLSTVACKMKKPGAAVLFIFSFVCSLAMGYLATKDFSKASMNWIAECVNVVGQGALLWAALILTKNGLTEFTLKKEEPEAPTDTPAEA